MKLQQELSVRNVETANTSSTGELRITIAGLQNKVIVEKLRMVCDVKIYQEITRKLENKQKIVDVKTPKLKSTLQARNEQMSRMTDTMSTMVDSIEELQS